MKRNHKSKTSKNFTIVEGWAITSPKIKDPVKSYILETFDRNKIVAIGKARAIFGKTWKELYNRGYRAKEGVAGFNK